MTLIKEMRNKLLNLLEIKFLIVHCSDTNSKKITNASHIHAMHLGFGWDGIGYHKIIGRNGLVENGRPEYWIGAHAYAFNEKSLGVCLIGKENFTTSQFQSLYKVLKNWTVKYPNAEIIGHKDTLNTTKTCPNFDVHLWCKERGLV
jgi:N-acetylmuramoyl-L-alanine amidase